MQIVDLPSPTAYWESYRGTIYSGKTLPPIQEYECKRAFLAGMEATYKIMFEVLAKELSDETSEVIIESYRILIHQHAYATHYTETN